MFKIGEFKGKIRSPLVPEAEVQRVDWDSTDRVVLGVDNFNRPFTMDFKDSIRMLVGGASGSGKTNTIKLFLSQLFYKRKMKVVVLNDKKSEYGQAMRPNEGYEHVFRRFDLEPRAFDLDVFVPPRAYDTTPRADREKKNYQVFSVDGRELEEKHWLGLLKIDEEKNPMMAMQFKGVLQESRAKTVSELSSHIEGSSDLKENIIANFLTRLNALESTGLVAEDSAEAITPKQLFKQGTVAVFESQFVEERLNEVVTSIVTEWAYKHIQKDRNRVALVVEEAPDVVGDRRSPSRDSIKNYGRLARAFGGSLILSTQFPTRVNIELRSNLDTMLLHKIVDQRAIEVLRNVHGLAVGPEIDMLRGFLPGQALVIDSKRSGLVQVLPSLCEHKKKG